MEVTVETIRDDTYSGASVINIDSIKVLNN